MKFNPMASANAAGVVTAGIYIVCRLFVGMFPGMMLGLARSWMHSIEVRPSAAGLSLPAFFTGLISSMLFAWLVGYFLAVAYNYFDKK